MAKYKIECEQFLGCSHCGAVYANGESTIELSDEEVDTLVQLMREKNTADVEKLDIETSHPDLYEKLDDAYCTMAYHAENMHWYWEGYENGEYEFEEEELMEYCEEECGFTFEEDDDDLDEDEREEAKHTAFFNWLDDYLRGLSDDDVVDFFIDHMNADVITIHEPYTVAIPDEIIKMAGIEWPTDEDEDYFLFLGEILE